MVDVFKIVSIGVLFLIAFTILNCLYEVIRKRRPLKFIGKKLGRELITSIWLFMSFLIACLYVYPDPKVLTDFILSGPPSTAYINLTGSSNPVFALAGLVFLLFCFQVFLLISIFKMGEWLVPWSIEERGVSKKVGEDRKNWWRQFFRKIWIRIKRW